MHRDGHVGIGLLAYAPLAFVLTLAGLLEPMLLGLAGVAVAGFAPDVDLRIPFVAHRGITHTALAAGLAGVVYAVSGVTLLHAGATAAPAGGPLRVAALTAATAAFGFAVGALGVASHVLGDALTPMGVQPWAPFDDRSYSLELVYAANPVANKGLALAGGAATALALAAGTALRTGSVPA